MTSLTVTWTLALQSFLSGSWAWLTTPHALSLPSIYPPQPTPTAALHHGSAPEVAGYCGPPIVDQRTEEQDHTEISVETDVLDVGTSKDLFEQADMKQPKTKAAIGILATLIAYVSVNSYFRTHDLFAHAEEDRWIATSKWWLDRKACRWLGLCGVPHVHFVGARFGERPILEEVNSTMEGSDFDWEHAWIDSSSRPENWTDDERRLREIPNYVLEYAPLVHLFSGEQFWPCDIAEHLYHTTPELNYTKIYPESRHPDLKHLNKFNKYENGRWVFLTSNDNPEERPEWLEGQKNIPVQPSDDDLIDPEDFEHHPGKTYLDGVKDGFQDLKEWFAPTISDADQKEDFRKSLIAQTVSKKNGSFRGRYHQELKRSSTTPAETPAEKPLRGGRSDAPAVLVVIDKGHGVVDAFWFFFYSFNLGNTVFNVRFGNHVGDWEHSMVRFHHGKPKAVYFSEHSFGAAYSYEAVEKIGKRPVIYSATGSHAMYATSGLHPYVLPWGILHDETDKGPLWDPALNAHAYTYETQNETLRPSNLTPNAPTGWFHYRGRWGDKYYPLGDNRQYRFAGQYHYVNGPTGPKFKHLNRIKVCEGPDENPCVIRHWLGGTENIRLAPDYDRDEKPGYDPR